MQPCALNAKQPVTSQQPGNAPAAATPIIPLRGRELPPVTDWDHFAAWCRQHGRQALPASDETLTLYFSDRRRAARRLEPTQGLGLLAITAAILGVLAPAIGLLATAFTSGNARFGLLTSILFFIGLQVVALGAGWSSRETPLGRAGWFIACLSTLAALSLGYLTAQHGGLPALENLLAFK